MIPLAYAIYAVFVGSANGLRRFSTQSGFDVRFSTMKTILLLALAFVWSVGGAFVGFAAAAVAIVVIASRVMRLPAGGEPFPMRRIAAFMGTVVAYTAVLNYTLNSDMLLLRLVALSAPGMTATAAATVTGIYEALRTFALLPYQMLLVVTFVIFPLVSRATFAADRDATRAYVSQTMRYAIILAGLMGIVLAARPSALFGTIYKPEYHAGATALPILATAHCCLALAVRRLLDPECVRARRRVAGADDHDRGDRLGRDRDPRSARRTRRADAGRGRDRDRHRDGHRPGRGADRVADPARRPCRRRRRWSGSRWRCWAAVIAARLVPGHGKIVGFAVMALTAVTYVAVLVVTREFGPEDRAKFARMVRRG